MGSTWTKSDRSFEITFDDLTFSDNWLEKSPEIYILIRNENGQIIHKTDILKIENIDKNKDQIEIPITINLDSLDNKIGLLLNTSSNDIYANNSQRILSAFSSLGDVITLNNSNAARNFQLLSSSINAWLIYTNELSWKRIGYDRPQVPKYPLKLPSHSHKLIGRKRKLIDKLYLWNRIFENRKENYKVINSDVLCDVDVCIIGSGAAGAILGTKLAESGKSVVVLEKGGYYDGESMNQRETDMIPLLWKNAGANCTGNLRIAIAQGSCLGGSTVINDAVCFKIPPLVIEQWQKKGVAITKGWDMANDEVSKRINVQEVTEEELNTNAKKLRTCEKFLYQGKSIQKHYKNQRNCGPSILIILLNHV